MAGCLNCTDPHSPESLVLLSVTASSCWPGLALTCSLPAHNSISLCLSLRNLELSLTQEHPSAPHTHVQLSSPGQPHDSQKHMHSYPGGHKHGDMHSSKTVERHNHAPTCTRVHTGMRASAPTYTHTGVHTVQIGTNICPNIHTHGCTHSTDTLRDKHTKICKHIAHTRIHRHMCS